MKLKCNLHGKRVVAVNGLFIHRNGRKNVVCDTYTVRMGDKKYDGNSQNFHSI